MDRAIIVDHLVKNFEVNETTLGAIGTVKSLLSPKKKIIHTIRSLSFTIQPGEMVGLLGVNGAGKTTILKILSGLLSPTSGFVEVLEYDPWERKTEFLRDIALIAGHKDQFWWDQSAQETLELNRATYQLPTREYEENLSELIEIFEVGKLLNTPVMKLSSIQRARIEFVAELIHKPKILFLDEPTTGLDLVSKQKVRDFIYKYNKKYNSTILMSSNNLDDLVDIVRRVIVVDQGKILFDGALEELVTKYSKEKIINAVFINDRGLDSLNQIGKVRKLSFPRVILSVPRETVYVAASELMQNHPVESLTIEELPVTEVVKNIK